MRIPRPGLTALALALSLAAGACRDLPTAAPPASSPAPATTRTELHCTVAVKSGEMSCEPNRPGGVRSQIILGGQGVNVRLRTTNVQWLGGDNVLTAEVAVQNLLDQPIGTSDGVTVYGERVFFVSGPVVTDGTGEVDVLTDSVGTFTAANQKYFVYNEIVQPRGVSATQTWTFTVPPEVVRFDFLVLVETATPAEQSALHFRPEHGSPVYAAPINGVYAASPHDVFAVSAGTVLHYDGNYWRAMDATPCGCATDLYGVWGSDGRDVWTVGAFASIYHWTGTTWDAVAAPDGMTNDLYSIWGGDANDIWAVGDQGTFLHWDGAEWTNHPIEEFNETVTSVWGTNVENVWAVTGSGSVLHFNGGGWAVDTAFATTALISVWGSSDSDVYAAGIGAADGPPGGVLYHYDGESWTQVIDPELAVVPLFSGWSGGVNDVWINSGGDVLHWDGESWTRMAVGSGAPLYAITGSGSDVFAVGDYGTIVHSTGGEFTTQAISDFDVTGLWGASANDVWAVGGPFILHRTGSAEWAFEPAPDFTFLNGVWGSSASDVWAVGEAGTIVHNDGGGWSSVHVDSALSLNGVGGTSSSNVWAVGNDGALLYWNGAAWSDQSFDAISRSTVWGDPSGLAIAVGEGGSAIAWNGSAWTEMNTGTSSSLNGVWGSGPADVYAVGDDGTVIHYDGNPEGDWTLVDIGGSTESVNGVWGSGPNDVFILANNGLNLMHWDGVSWHTMAQYSSNADVWMYTIWGTGPNNLYTAGDVGTILHGQR